MTRNLLVIVLLSLGATSLGADHRELRIWNREFEGYFVGVSNGNHVFKTKLGDYVRIPSEQVLEEDLIQIKKDKQTRRELDDPFAGFDDASERRDRADRRKELIRARREEYRLNLRRARVFYSKRGDQIRAANAVRSHMTNMGMARSMWGLQPYYHAQIAMQNSRNRWSGYYRYGYTLGRMQAEIDRLRSLEGR